MNDFVSIEILTTIVGCAALVTLLTEIFKKYLPQNIDTKWLSLIFSVIIGIIRIIYVGQFDFAGIISGIINIFILLGSSIGIFEVSKSVANIVKKEE